MIASLDTNAVLALVLEDRPTQQAAVINLLEVQGCNISDLVFPEVEYTLRVKYNMSRQEIASNLRAILSLRNIKGNVGLILEALDMYICNPALSFTDCWLAVEAGITRRSPLYTFDKKLANQSGGLAKLLI